MQSSEFRIRATLPDAISVGRRGRRAVVANYILSAFCLLTAPLPAAAQSPVVNAKVERRPAPQGLAAAVQAVVDRGTAAWVGYQVPIATRSNGRLQIGDTCCGRCRLEPPTTLVVLARVDGRAIIELRPVAQDCDIDAAGMPLVWLEGVNPDESAAWLASMVDKPESTTPRRIRHAALLGLSLHAAPSAAPALIAAARRGTTADTRSQALFWLAQRAADGAAAAIAASVDNDPDVEVKKKAVFALSQLPRDEGVPLLIDVARRHRTLDVRRQAMFWLGQSKDPRAIDFFEQILLK